MSHLKIKISFHPRATNSGRTYWVICTFYQQNRHDFMDLKKGKSSTFDKGEFVVFSIWYLSGLMSKLLKLAVVFLACSLVFWIKSSSVLESVPVALNCNHLVHHMSIHRAIQAHFKDSTRRTLLQALLLSNQISLIHGSSIKQKTFSYQHFHPYSYQKLQCGQQSVC